MILNLTQHKATPAQISAGVVDVEDQQRLKKLLTFTDLAEGLTKEFVEARAKEIVAIFVPPLQMDTANLQAMIGGAGFLMAPLERELLRVGVRPVHALSERISVETIDDDGVVRKSQQFKHIGFYEV